MVAQTTAHNVTLACGLLVVLMQCAPRVAQERLPLCLRVHLPRHSVYVSLEGGVRRVSLALWEPTALVVPMLGAPAARAPLRPPMRQVPQALNCVCACLGAGLTPTMQDAKLAGTAHASNVPRVPFRMVETGQNGAPTAILCCPIALDQMGRLLLMTVFANLVMEDRHVIYVHKGAIAQVVYSH